MNELCNLPNVGSDSDEKEESPSRGRGGRVGSHVSPSTVGCPGGESCKPSTVGCPGGPAISSPGLPEAL